MSKKIDAVEIGQFADLTALLANADKAETERNFRAGAYDDVLDVLDAQVAAQV